MIFWNWPGFVSGCDPVRNRRKARPGGRWSRPGDRGVTRDGETNQPEGADDINLTSEARHERVGVDD